MPNSIFINYRRSDSQHAAIAIAETLRYAFADGEVFFDRASLKGGEVWPKAIRDAMEQARVVVAVIGKDWCRASDEYGRRRIDHPDDWVRQELTRAAERGITIFPVLLEDANVPPPAALDASLHGLCQGQVQRVSAESWDADLTVLIDRLKTLTNAALRERQRFPNGTPISRPAPEQEGQEILSSEELHEKLTFLPCWQEESNYHPWAIEGVAQEIARVYEFTSFRHALAFMVYAGQELLLFDKPQHHPRWENQWRSVKVWFTTWDVGCRVTKLDILAAQRMDALFVRRDLVACG